jgi:hypothetical protein
MSGKLTEEDRTLLLERFNAAYAALRKNRKEWIEVQEELAEWDCTLLDGLDEEPCRKTP